MKFVGSTFLLIIVAFGGSAYASPCTVNVRAGEYVASTGYVDYIISYDYSAEAYFDLRVLIATYSSYNWSRDILTLSRLQPGRFSAHTRGLVSGPVEKLTVTAADCSPN